MTFEQMLERVRYEDAYPTRARAEEASRAVLAVFGRQLTGDQRVELAARLPHEAAVTSTSENPAAQPLTLALQIAAFYPPAPQSRPTGGIAV